MEKPTETKAPGQCHTKGCKESATWRVFWPGREPLKMCNLCADRARGVGDAMGCLIHVEPLPVKMEPAP